MYFPPRQRFHPRGQQDRDRIRREAEYRDQLADLAARLEALEKEQKTQMVRFAQIQAQIDHILKLIEAHSI